MRQGALRCGQCVACFYKEDCGWPSIVMLQADGCNRDQQPLLLIPEWLVYRGSVPEGSQREQNWIRKLGCWKLLALSDKARKAAQIGVAG